MFSDIRYALRILRKNRGFAAVAVLSLALGIGANTAIFTLIDNVMLRTLPVRAPEQLAVLASNPDKPSVSFNYPDYVYVRDHNQSYSGVLASSEGSTTAFSVPGEKGASAEVIAIGRVSGNYFDVLGVGAAIGRLLTPADNVTEGAHPVAVLSWEMWQRRFGGENGVLGRSIALNGVPFQVIGVAARGFHGTQVGTVNDLFVPIMMMPTLNPPARGWNSRHWWWLTVLARMKPGTTLNSATSELNVLWQQILKADPEYKPPPAWDKTAPLRDRRIVLPGSAGWSFFRVQFSKPLTVLMIVVGMVLLIACANVANLLLARAAGRQKEIAVRLAIGAGRSRLVSQLVVETVVVSLLGGITGLVFAWWGIRVLVGLLPKRAIPIDLNLSPDWRVLGFAFLASLVTGLLCGLVPALQSTRPNLVTALKNETAVARRSRFDLRRILVVAQVALSLLLLAGAGLFVRSLSNLEKLDPGFVRERVLLVSVNPQNSGYLGKRLRDYYERLLAKTAANPEVRTASLVSITPLAGSRWNNEVSFIDYKWGAQERHVSDMNSATPHFFETLGIPMVAGRDFTDQDSPTFTPDGRAAPDPKLKLQGPRVAIVNESFAKKFFANRSAIGERVCRDKDFKMEESLEIVGVVKDVRYFGLREPTEPMIYIPIWRDGAGGRTLCVRTSGDPSRVVAAIRREAAVLDPTIPVTQTLTLADQFDNNIAQERILTMLCTFFGVLAVLLAAIGLYGVMAHAVARRVREIGIRMALGAQAPEVRWLILRETALMVGCGAAIGLPAAYFTTRLVESFLFGLTPQDPLTLALSTLALLAVTAIAGYIPARRATRVDPMIALRYE
ncbi:MAG TPA: ABC transporter permease [Candidatus Solibacter sp.]